MIQLRVPGSLGYRNLLLRVVAEACNMVEARDCSSGRSEEIDDEFKQQTVTAVGEAFNNIAIHGYAGAPPDLVEIQIEPRVNQIVVRLLDTGRSFDPGVIPNPELEMLPERGMGLFIIKSFMDDISYQPGAPNVLCLTKRRSVEPAVDSTEPGDAPERRQPVSGSQVRPASARDGSRILNEVTVAYPTVSPPRRDGPDDKKPSARSGWSLRSVSGATRATGGLKRK